MNSRGLLDQLLKSGQSVLQQKNAGGGFLSGAAGGALAAGALGILLGNKSARKVGGKVITYGGLAALGALAYKAYGNWREQQGAQSADNPPQTVDRLSSPQIEQHSQAVLKALVAAAKADGHVDAKEQAFLQQQLEKLAGSAELRQWLNEEVNKPLEPAELAKAATTPEIAAEMYLASLLMVDEQNFMERAYLDELARQLKLEPGFRAELEAQVREQMAAVV